MKLLHELDSLSPRRKPMNARAMSIVVFLLLATLVACPGGSNIIASITDVQINAANLTMSAGGSQTVSATVSGMGAFDNTLNWTIQSGGGTLSATTGSSVAFTAPTSSGTSVVRVTSVQDSSKFDSVSIAIQASNPTSSITGISLEAAKVNLRASESSALTATVTGTGAFNNAVTWSIESGGIGTLSSITNTSVTYNAPTSSFGKVVRIKAVSIQDATKQQIIFLGLHPSQPSLAAGGTHVLAIKSDGTLLAWGGDDFGKLGNNDDLHFNQNAPVAVSGASDIVAVAAGQEHSLALKANGTVLAWGNDTGGQLGDNATLEDKPTPVVVSGASNIIAISAGYYFSLALKSDGTMLAWGNNSRGQLGDSVVKADKPTPVAVSGASDIVAIGAGSEHSLALKTDGTMLAWGLDVDGQLGDNVQLTDQPLPVAVMTSSIIVGISAGTNHSLAVTSSGNVLAWGSDFAGQLGDNIPKVNKPTPVTVSGASNIVAVAGGWFHSLALKADGTVLAWGSDTYGELGDGNQINPQGIPVVVENANSIVAIAANLHLSLALKSDGTVQSWGRNNSGQLGDNTGINQNSPVAVLLGAFTIRVP